MKKSGAIYKSNQKSDSRPYKSAIFPCASNSANLGSRNSAKSANRYPKVNKVRRNATNLEETKPAYTRRGNKKSII